MSENFLINAGSPDRFELADSTRELPARPTSWPFLLILLLAFAVIGATGYWHYAQQRSTDRANALEQIRAIGNLKAQQLERWLKERRGDTETLYNDHLAIGLLPYLADPDNDALRAKTRAWMKTLTRYYSYSTILLVDAEGKPLLKVQSGDLAATGPERGFIERALSSGKVVISDLYINANDGNPRLDYIVPILPESKSQNAPLAALLLRVDPDDFLFPLLDGWPTRSQSAETQLIRRHADHIIYLNQRRHHAGEPVLLKQVPYDASELVAAMALREKNSEVEGHDYRGEHVLAAVRPIADSDWYMLAKVDSAEVYAPSWRKARRTGLIIALLGCITVLLAWLGWYRQGRRLLEWQKRTLEQRVLQRTEALSSANRLMQHEVGERRSVEQALQRWARVVDASKHGVVIVDVLDPAQPVISVNPAFERITGYAAADVLGRNCRFLQKDDREQKPLDKLRTAVQNNSACEVLLRNYRRDGSLFWNELFIAPVFDQEHRLIEFIGLVNDVTARQAYESELEQLARYDSLTQLANRTSLMDRLAHALAHAQRGDQGFAVLFIDIDRFKRINDSLGHANGDLLLHAIGARLRECFRQDDTVARFGGDEFVILLEDFSKAQQVFGIAYKALAAIGQPLMLAGSELTLNASIGVSLYPQDGQSAEELLHSADAAMYRVKQLGGAGVQFYTSALKSRAQDLLNLETQLRQALQTDQLEIHYQPQIELRSDTLIGLEALLRWQHPQRGAIPPLEFVSLAEDVGLIDELGDWVVREVCRQVSAWQKAGLSVPRVAINVSPRQFRRAGLAQRITEILQEYGLYADCLELEITENMLMQNVEEATAMLQTLQADGITIAIDDFGTGHASLSYLRQLPVTRLKIDKSFVCDIDSSADAAAIAATIIRLAQGLHLQVIAEGVETEQQLRFLVNQGCDAGQGYYFNRPLTARATELSLVQHTAAVN